MWTKAQKAENAIWVRALGQVVRRLRKEKGVTQAAMESAIRVPRGYISRIETGAGNPRIDVLAGIAIFLGLSSLTELCWEVENEYDRLRGKPPGSHAKEVHARRVVTQLRTSGRSHRSRVRSTD